MPRGGAHFSSEELVRVLSHYNIGIVHEVRPLTGGNRRAPKVVITSERGKFLLKRRPRGNDDLHRVAFAHAVQKHLAKKGFAVTSLMSTRDDKNTVLQIGNHIYEFFKFVTGVRYDGSSEATVDAGRQLAKLHKYLAGFSHEWKPSTDSFHDSKTVRRHLKTVGADKMAGPNKRMQSTAEALMILYNGSSVHVNQFGFDSWNQQVVHGDWHPGNMLFSEGRVVAALDFDSIRIAPTVVDLANGMLQFAIVGDRPNPADWPDYFDQGKLDQFLNGYRSMAKLGTSALHSLVDLMIETIIAEAVLPVAATGSFGHLSGLDFLKMILRKANWLNKHRQQLTQTIEG
ncbi:MAG: phosphotransferase [Phycisphaerales bacterium]|nr:MAG: phosphotransferase [Phycisphaerales bacterium]